MSDRIDAPSPLQLPQELTIYAVGDLHPQWLAWLAQAARSGSEDATVDGSVVEQVDAAGLQLLVSLHRGLAERGVRLRLQAPANALRDAAQALGLWALLSTDAAVLEGAPA